MALTSKAPSKSIRPPKRNPAARTRSRVPARRRPPPQKRFSLASPRSLERRGRCPRRFSFSTASRRPPRFLNLTRSISGVSLARKCTERFCHGPVTPVRRLPDLAAVLCLLWRRLVQYRRANASATLPGLCPQSFHHVHLGYARHEQQCGHGLGEPGERFYRLGAGHLDRPACRRNLQSSQPLQHSFRLRRSRGCQCRVLRLCRDFQPFGASHERQPFAYRPAHLLVQPGIAASLPRTTFIRTDSLSALDFPSSEWPHRHLVYDAARKQLYVANRAMNRIEVFSTMPP